MAALFAAGSAATLFAQQVRPTTLVETLSGSSAHALHSEGTLTAAVFIESSTEHVYVTVSSDGSLTWSSPQRVDSDTGFVPKALVQDAIQVRGGEVHVAWIEAPLAGPDSIRVRRSGDGGFSFEAESTLPSGGAAMGEIGSARLEVWEDEPYDDVHVLYRLDPGSGSHELYLASSDASVEDSFLPPAVVRATSGSDVSGMDLSVKDHWIHVVWVDDRNGDNDLWYRRSFDRGLTWTQSGGVRIDSGTAGAEVEPDARIIAAGPAYNWGGGPKVIGPGGASNLGSAVWCAWREDATTPGVPELLSRASTDTGTSFPAPLQIGGYTAGADAVLAFDLQQDELAGWVVAWEDERQGSSHVFAARSLDKGSTWIDEAQLSSVSSVGPRLTYHPDGTAAVAWIEPGLPDAVGSAYSLDAGATWSPPLLVSSSLGVASSVELVYNPACENLIHAWLDDEGGTTNVTGGGYLVGSCSCFFAAAAGPTGCSEREYAPTSIGAGHARQRLTVFYPDEDEFTKPADGWPVLLYSPAGAFAEAAPLGTDGSAAPGICGEPPTTSSTASGIGLKLLNDALQSGWAVITVGTIGWNSPPIGGRDPNLFFDQDSTEWNTGDALWGEQELTWARQYVALYADTVDSKGCPPLDVDNDSVVVCGTSTGAIYSAFVALGPDRADPGSSDVQLQQSTRCAGAVLFESPSWFPAYEDTLPGLHWPSVSDSSQRADQLLEADPADLIASSVSTWLRDPDSMAVDTPVFLAFDEPLQSPSFGRLGSCEVDPAANDPSLVDLLDQYVHDSWFGLVAYEDLSCIDASFHFGQSRLWLASSVDLSLAPATQAQLPSGFFSGSVQGDELQEKALAWLLGPRASTAVRNTVGSNTSYNSSCYESVSAPVLCGSWQAEVDVSSHPGATLTTLLTYADAFATPLIYKGFAVFVDITMPAIDASFVVPVGGSALHQSDVPGDPALAGQTFYTQAGILGGGLELCNGVDISMGG